MVARHRRKQERHGSHASKTGKVSKMLRHMERKNHLEVHPTISKEISLILVILFVAFTFLSLNGGSGFVGEAWFKLLSYAIGLWGIYLLMTVFSVVALGLLFHQDFKLNFTRWFGIVLLFISVLGLFGISADINNASVDTATAITGLGGYIGFFANVLLKLSVGEMGARIVLFAISIIALLLIFQRSIVQSIRSLLEPRPVVPGVEKKTSQPLPQDQFAITGLKQELKKIMQQEKEKKAAEFVIKKPGDVAEKQETFKKKDILPKTKQEWVFPPLDLLEAGSMEVVIDEDLLKSNRDKIKDKLAQFDIPVVMRDLNVGPTVMQYTLEPPPDVKLSKITSLKNDLALALAAKSIRIEAPIPGKALVGIEIPNEKRIIVHLRDIIESKEFFEVKSPMRFPLGRDVSGKSVVDALDFMPHLLIAGATGSGKSVAINSFLISLLYQNSPRDLKMILVDPKRVELSGYTALPHLLTPVITDPEKAINALRWTVGEMIRRYKELQSVGARNREEYNKKVAPENKLPYIVFVVDELADLMMTSFKKEVETLICRIAQMARAVGIHLVIATQRPSVDVITGIIKANIPARIAFSVVSSIDSRTILDSIGAEDLIGKGDLLYVSSNMSKPMRIQGVYVSSDEIERVTTQIRMTIEPEYDEEVTTPKKMEVGDVALSPAGAGSGLADASDDVLIAQAIQVIRETGLASTSLFQRRLKLGFARAGRIMDELEKRGIVGPGVGSKPRDIKIEVDSRSESPVGQEEY